jgi:hypothetical protein
MIRKASDSLSSRHSSGSDGGYQTDPPTPHGGGDDRFQIQTVGGSAAYPLPPILSDAHVPGRIVHADPDGATRLAGFTKVSAHENFRPITGGSAGYPPTPMQGGYDRFETQIGEGGVWQRPPPQRIQPDKNRNYGGMPRAKALLERSISDSDPGSDHLLADHVGYLELLPLPQLCPDLVKYT